MPTLNQVAKVTINKNTVFPSAKGFGTPMFVCYQTVKPGKRLQEFSDLSEVTAAGYATTHRVYKAAQVVFAQNPRPEKFVVGSRYLPSTQVVVFTPLELTVGYEYKFTAVDDDGVEYPISYTVQTSDTATLIVTGLKADLDAVTDMVTSGTTTCICTATAGKLIEYKDLPPGGELGVSVTTADPGIATDMAAIMLATERSRGGFSWYGFTLDSCGEAEANAARVWAESNTVFFMARNSDSLAMDPGTTTDLLSDVKTAAAKRTSVIFAQRAIQDYRDLAFLANYFAANVPEGSAGPCYKLLANIDPDSLTIAEANAINNKYGTTYTTLNSRNITFEGHTGDGDWMDTTVNLDWLSARIQEAVFGGQVTAKKIPFTQAGMDTIGGLAQAIMDQAVVQSVLAPFDTVGAPPTITVPKLAQTTGPQRAARLLTNIKGSGRIAGAIHRAEFTLDIGV